MVRISVKMRPLVLDWKRQLRKYESLFTGNPGVVVGLPKGGKIKIVGRKRKKHRYRKHQRSLPTPYSSSYKNSLTYQLLTKIAFINEYGGGHVPERALMRLILRAGRARIKALLHSQLYVLKQGNYSKASANSSMNKSLQHIGTEMVKMVQHYIDLGPAPENAQSTIKKKGFNAPLFETGTLRASIQYKTVKNAW